MEAAKTTTRPREKTTMRAMRCDMGSLSWKSVCRGRAQTRRSVRTVVIAWLLHMTLLVTVTIK